ncbi:jg1024 [Pararge aegeria aegeria]|uniref:Jg1024 protein n=1 Tax=Pararge aegeria aegeria TaxID=348720 RepID=A0A8S4SJ05_9NEOP|nr:jg1024 [Pararge aegeria aegeria]
MAKRSQYATPENSDEESGDAFTDGDFGDSDDETIIERKDYKSNVTETVNQNIADDINISIEGKVNGRIMKINVNGADHVDINNQSNGEDSGDLYRDSQSDNGSIVGILGDQQNHAEQRLAARRAARAEAREIRMRELERQQREQEDHADKAYDMYSETVGRRAGCRLAALSPASAMHSPRRSSEDSEDVLSIKDLRHELKEVEEKFRKAMILNAQLDNDKAALGYQLELLKDRIEELQEEYAQLQILLLFAEYSKLSLIFIIYLGFPQSNACFYPISLMLADVRLERLVSAKATLEGEVRKLKLQLNDERAARQNGVASHLDRDHDTELETLRKSVAEAKGRAARAEAEAALQAAAVARLEAQVARLRARQDHQDEHEEMLKQERRKLQREAREALNRVEELETENSHLTKRLDKLKNAKSALLKEL